MSILSGEDHRAKNNGLFYDRDKLIEQRRTYLLRNLIPVIVGTVVQLSIDPSLLPTKPEALLVSMMFLPFSVSCGIVTAMVITHGFKNGA